MLAVSYAYVGSKDRQRVVRRLLDSGRIDPNARDKTGTTALSYALESGCAAVYMMFLEWEGLDVHTRDQNRRTLLFWAVKGDREVAVPLLLAKGANPNQVDAKVQTPLSVAAESGHPKTVERLLSDDRVIRDARDSTRCTPLSLAMGQMRDKVSYE